MVPQTTIDGDRMKEAFYSVYTAQMMLRRMREKGSPEEYGSFLSYYDGMQAALVWLGLSSAYKEFARGIAVREEDME